MPGSRDVGQYLRGAAYGLAAVSIWSGWIVVARLGLAHQPDAVGHCGAALWRGRPVDASARRSRRGSAFDRLGWSGLAAIVLGGAAPVFLANTGLLFAPAAHAGALFPGVMPLMVALLAWLVLGEAFTPCEKFGLR